MNVCMIVHNNGTRDGRVMREAHVLQAAGHMVTVIGIPESGASEPLEILADGVRVIRVNWYPKARRRLVRSAIIRAPLLLAVFGAVAYGMYRLVELAAGHAFAGHSLIGRFSAALSGFAATAAHRRAVAWSVLLVAALGVSYAIWRAGRSVRSAISQRALSKEFVRRQVISGGHKPKGGFPAIRSRIPGWLPDWVLEYALEPIAWLGARTGKFSQYRYRSEELAAAAIGLKPDIVHCHDCVALPTGWLVKKALNIPLVYDAHEIYEAVAARRFGATDYFARVHHKYLDGIDGFIAVNDSAASYYRHAYPAAPPAIVIRNAIAPTPLQAYDGRLHRAAGLPPGERILLYQGGYTKDRGLPTLVRAGPLLPDGWSLVMMGWGPLLGELREIVANGNSAKVYFIPAVPPSELLAWTQGATAGIIPYEDKMLNHWIATPNKLWEYPGAGVPLIVQPFPELRRVVETYRCGWLLPDELTPAAIAGLVASLTDEKIAAAREGCRRFIEADSWPAIYRDRLLNLYEDIERRGASGRREKTDAPASA
jgi:glycosyltransferase involved in cell wall biosynthesis